MWLLSGKAIIALVGVLYAIVALEQGSKGFFHNTLIFGGYALSNIGLFMVTK